MSKFAGYDFVLELAQPYVRDLVIQDLQLDGQLLRPPAEFLRSFKVTQGGVSVSGAFHVVIDDVEIDIGNPNGDEVFLITAAFSQGSIRTASRTACPLGGVITLTVPLAIDVGPICRVVADLPSADASVAFDQQSTDVLDASLGVFGLTAADVTATMSAEVMSSVKAAGRQPIGDQAFKLAPGMNGSVTPLTFTEAALACVYDTDRGRQVFVLLGILLAANTGQGNPAQKTRSIPINRNVALSLSPAAFRAFVFCPGIATPLGLPPGTAAPGVCGGSPVTVSGVTITGVTDRFTAGSINVDVTFTNSGFCYTTDGAVTMTLTPKVSAGTLSWAVSSEQPTITVSIPYYCYLAAIVLHPILAVVLWVFDSLADGLASRTAGSSLKSLLEGILLPGNPGPFVVEEVLVDEEGLTIASTATVQLPLAMQPSASLKVTREFVRSEQVANGELVLPAPCNQEAKYRWSEERRWLRQVLVVETSLYGHPIYASWELLDASGVSIPLIGFSGTVQVPVNATYQTASSTTAVQRDATISWRQFGLGGSMLILTNDPSDGSYIVEVAAQVSNCANTLQRTLVHPLAFDGHVLERHASGLIGLLECLPEWVDRFELPPDILREEWSLSLPTSMAGRALMAIVAVDDPAVDQLAQTIPVLLAPELRDAALRFSSAKEFNE